MTVIGVIAVAIAVVGIVARHVSVTNHATLFLGVAGPFLALMGPVGFACFVAARRSVPAVLALFVIVLSVVPLTSGYLGSSEGRAGDRRVRIITANLEYGGAQMDTLAGEALARGDLLAVQELTGEAVRELRAAGLETAFPFTTLHPQQDAGGIGLWSRFPIVSSSLVSGFQMPSIEATVRTGPGGHTLRVLVVHVSGPWPQPITGWQRDIAALSATLRRVADESGADPVVVAGDFNATSDLRPFRDLLGHGYGNAAAQAGEGRLPTFPSGAMIPAGLDIDHILTRNCTASSAATIPLHGSDHRALIATVGFSL